MATAMTAETNRIAPISCPRAADLNSGQRTSRNRLRGGVSV
jgi:hypothetical protein